LVLRVRGYWAGETSQKKLISRCLERVAWATSAMRQLGRLDTMFRMMSAHYGRGTDNARDSRQLLDAGEQGEVTEMHVNLVKPTLTTAMSIIAGVRPGVKPVATNSSSESASQTRLAAALNDFYERKLSAKGLEIDTVRGGLICGSWSLVQTWAQGQGQPIEYDVEGDRLIYEGDLEIFTVPPWRIFYEPTATVDTERRWCLFRRKLPRWDLVARAKDPYVKQKLEDGAEKPSSNSAQANPYQSLLTGYAQSWMGLDALLGETWWSEDEVWVWELRHLPSPALPMGRLVRFVEPDVVLFDSYAAGEPADQQQAADADMGDASDEPPPGAVAYPFSKTELHAYEYCPERIVGSAQGHSSMFDMLGLQEFHDTCTASIATTVNLMGMPHLWSGGGAAPQVYQLSTGPSVIDTPVRPELIDLPALKAEVVQAAEWAKTLMQQMAALNETVMGNPEKGMPASAQALQRAQAVQYHQVAQDEWMRLVEKNANGRLRLLKRFARTQRVAEIAGPAGAWEVKQWQAEDIADVERFQVEKVDPMSATFEGRQAMAEMLGIQGDALLDFMQTGSLKKVTETRTMQLELVERNKALLLRGIGLPPVDQAASMAAGRPVFQQTQGEQEFVVLAKSDPHHLAIPSYLSVINSPEARRDDALMVSALDVVTESMRLWLTLTPDECAAFQIPPLPSTAAMAMMPPVPPGPAPTAEDGAPAALEGQPDENVKLPAPPENPITGATQDAGATGLA